MKAIDELSKVANAEFMKFVAGKFMFCYISNAVLDYKTTVHIAIRNNDKCVATYAIHKSIWHDNAVPQLFAGIKAKGLQATEIQITSIDGEQIHKAK